MLISILIVIYEIGIECNVFTSQKKMKILTFSTRRQNSLNGVLDETTTANTRGRSSRAHARLCKFTSGSRPSSSRRPILRSLLTAGRFRRCWEEKTTRNNRMKIRLTFTDLLQLFTHWTQSVNCTESAFLSLFNFFQVNSNETTFSYIPMASWEKELHCQPLA